MSKQEQNYQFQQKIGTYSKQQNDDKILNESQSLSEKRIQKKIYVSSHAGQYQRFQRQINLQPPNIQIEYEKFFFYNKIWELPISGFSKNVLLKHYKNLEASNIKLSDTFQNKTTFQIKDLSQHGQIVEITVKFSFFQFIIKILNFQETCQGFIQPTVQIGKGAYGSIFSYVFNKKRVAIKKIKITNISKETEQTCYNVKNPIFQYCIYKLLSVVQLGLKLSQQVFGFDLICFQDVACFNMEEGLSVYEAVYSCLLEVSKMNSSLYQSLFFLHDLHIIHYDIKPQNILFSRQYNRTVLIDFGISQIVSQKQGQLTLSNFKGTYQYCCDSFKRLLLNQQPGLVDVYWNDTFALNVSIQIVNKNVKLNLISYGDEDSISNSQNQYLSYYADKSTSQKFRNFYLQAKLIYLIFSESQTQISEFLAENNVNIVCVLPILIEIHPTMIIFRIFKLFFEQICQNLESTNELKHEILNIYQLNTFKTVLKYDLKRNLKFHKKFQQSQFQSQDSSELIMRTILLENIAQVNNQNIFLCYFYFLQWLAKLNFFVINEKIISQDKIIQILRLFGRKFLGTQSDTQEISQLLYICLQKILKESVTKNRLRFSNTPTIGQINQQKHHQKKQNKNICVDQQINIATLYKLGIIYYRLGLFVSCKECFEHYLNFICRPLEFFFTLFQLIKLTFFNLKMNIFTIYKHYSSLIGIQTDLQFIQKYQSLFSKQKYDEIDYYLNLSDKIVFLWQKASQKQKNLFLCYLQIVKILFIPKRVQFAEFNNFQQKSIKEMSQKVKKFLKKLQNKEIDLPDFHRQKLIADIYYHFNDCDLFRELDEAVRTYYMLLQKKYEKYIFDIHVQKLYILIANTLQNMHLQDESIKIFDNVKENNIFGITINDSDTCLYYKALKLQKKQINSVQAKDIKVKLLQKIIERGYQKLKNFDTDLFTIHRIVKYYGSLSDFQLKYYYYFELKKFLSVYESDEKNYIKTLLNIFNMIYIRQFQINQNQEKRLQDQYNFIENRVQEIFQQNQIPNSYWITKANHMEKHYGNLQKLQIYRKAYKFFGKNDENYFNVIFYIFALRIERIKAIQESKQQDPNYISPKEQIYNNEILKIYKDLELKRKFYFAISPHYLPFHRIILEIFMKTKQYSLVTNNFVKITTYIKKLTSIHNSEIINLYKNVVKGFFSDPHFLQQSFKQLLKNASQLFLNSSSEQIARNYPQILYYYSCLLMVNRKIPLNEKSFFVLLKIMNLLKFAYKKTKIQIKSFFQYMMTEVSQEWSLVKKIKFKVAAKRKYFLTKCLRSSQHCSKQKKFFWKQIKKLSLLKNVKQGTFFQQRFIKKIQKMIQICH